MKSFLDYKKTFDIDIYDLMDKVVKGNRGKKIIEFNHDQLQDGTDALGKEIKTLGGHPYMPYTIKLRKAKGLQTNKVDLKYTGEFYKTFKVSCVKGGYEVIATFKINEGSILDNFSSSYDFLGLDTESLNEWVDDYLFPVLITLIKKKLGI